MNMDDFYASAARETERTNTAEKADLAERFGLKVVTIERFADMIVRGDLSALHTERARAVSSMVTAAKRMGQKAAEIAWFDDQIEKLDRHRHAAEKGVVHG